MSNRFKKPNKNKTPQKPETDREKFLKAHPVFNKIYTSLNTQNTVGKKPIKIYNNIISTIFVSFILISLFIGSEHKAIGLVSGMFFTILNSITPIISIIKKSQKTESIILIGVNAAFFIVFLLLLIF